MKRKIICIIALFMMILSSFTFAAKKKTSNPKKNVPPYSIRDARLKDDALLFSLKNCSDKTFTFTRISFILKVPEDDDFITITNYIFVPSPMAPGETYHFKHDLKKIALEFAPEVCHDSNVGNWLEEANITFLRVYADTIVFDDNIQFNDKNGTWGF